MFNLQERGRMMISPGEEVYEDQVVGIHARDNDLTVNPLKAKQLTNIRAAGSNANILLTPPIRFSLEQALEFIEDDERTRANGQEGSDDLPVRRRADTGQCRRIWDFPALLMLDQTGKLK